MANNNMFAILQTVKFYPKKLKQTVSKIYRYD